MKRTVILFIVILVVGIFRLANAVPISINDVVRGTEIVELEEAKNTLGIFQHLPDEIFFNTCPHNLGKHFIDNNSDIDIFKWTFVRSQECRKFFVTSIPNPEKPVPNPEPASWLLFVFGVIGIIIIKNRKAYTYF